MHWGNNWFKTTFQNKFNSTSPSIIKTGASWSNNILVPLVVGYINNRALSTITQEAIWVSYNFMLKWMLWALPNTSTLTSNGQIMNSDIEVKLTIVHKKIIEFVIRRNGTNEDCVDINDWIYKCGINEMPDSNTINELRDLILK